MKEILRKAVDFGMGVFAVSKEKAETFVEEMVQHGEIQREEASRVVDRIVEKGKEQRHQVESYIDEQIAKRVGNFATKEDVRRILREELAAARATQPQDVE